MKTEERFSEWIESFRKDAECVFGILKGRFRILKTGIRLDGPQAADRIWLTCCALHNWLLEADGLDDWDGELGLNDLSDMAYAPFALQRLQQEDFERFGSRQHEEEAALAKQFNRRRGILLDEDVADGEDNNEDIGIEDEDPVQPGMVRYNDHGATVVNSLTYDDFRNRLVEHFDILFRQQKVRWPVRAVKTNNNSAN
jgi:DDE superfamily endonuclease